MTDEDSGPEDNDGEIDNLLGALLQCYAEAVVRHCVHAPWGGY